MNMQQIVDDIATEMSAEIDRGKVADYIPQLAHVDPNQFGIAVATPDGQVYTAVSYTHLTLPTILRV